MPTGASDTWTIDLHYPHDTYGADRGFGGDEFISTARHTAFKTPYWVPYRCLYSRNISNLFMAGRDISVTHEALGTVRVQRTTGMMARSSAWPPRSASRTTPLRAGYTRIICFSSRA